VFYRKINNNDFITTDRSGISYSQLGLIYSLQQLYGVEFHGTAEVSDWYSLSMGETFSEIEVNASNYLAKNLPIKGSLGMAKLNQDFKLPYWGI